ncbi:MAG: ABC transporter permease [Clostridiales bacterium]|nr:ABC transporter permease [Clostridiales bacterium]
MLQYIARRVLFSIPVLLIVTIFVFFIMRVLPGNPGRAILGPEADPATVEAFNRAHGLDQPLPVQYIRWLGDVLHGDLGRSLIDGTPVSILIAQRLPATIELTIGAMLVAVLIAIPAGIIAATRRGQAIDHAGTIVALAGLSIPQFWLAILLIMYFSVRLGWLPASGYVPIWENPVANLKVMILPIVVTGLRESAVLMRMTRSSLLEVLNQDYIRTARAKGLPGWVVVVRHGVRNSLIPVLTVGGLQLAGLLGGLVITETIFVIPGFGRLIVDSIFNRDLITLQGAVLVAATLVVLVNLLVDVLYAWLDPRIKLSGGAAA